MKYLTKYQRLVAITDAWCEQYGKSSFTTIEVSDWALAENLSPVPKCGDPREFCLAWESRLDHAHQNRHQKKLKSKHEKTAIAVVAEADSK